MSEQSMRILITGGAGCLGSNLVEYWLPLGHQIFVIDNFVTGKSQVLPKMEGLIVKEGSIADQALVEGCFNSFKPDIVIHAAAAYKDPDNWVEDASTNVIGSVHIARAARNYEVKRLINFQTALCYGKPQQLPIPINHPMAPFTSYGITKTAGEQLMLLSGVPTVSLRIANVTGPRLAIGPIPNFYKRLKSGQECFCSDSARDFLDMSDFLAFMDLVVKFDAPNGVFNIGTGTSHSVKEIFDLVTSFLKLGHMEVLIAPLGADDIPIVSLDPTQTFRVFGWKAKVGFEDTVRRQLEWYDTYGVSDLFSHLRVQQKKISEESIR